MPYFSSFYEFHLSSYPEKNPTKLHLRVDYISMDNLRRGLFYPESIKKWIVEKYQYTNKQVLDNELTTQLEELIQIGLNDKQPVWKRTCIYTLPTSPNLLLHFIDVFKEATNSDNWGKRFTKLSITNRFRKGSNQLSISIEEYVNLEKFDYEDKCVQALINELINCATIPSCYVPAIDAVKKVKDFKPNETYIKIEERLPLLWNGIENKLINPSISAADKLNELLVLARKYIRCNLQADLNYMLTTFHFYAKYKLFDGCIGKQAHDTFDYTWDHSEWGFLIFAEFTMRDDGLLIIADIKNNKEYQRKYAPGMENAGLLEPEMRHLAKVLELEFESCDETEMVFTLESTKKLMQQGLHYNVAFLKKLLLASNYAMYFNHRNTTFYSASPIAALPSDVRNIVVHQSLPHHKIPTDELQVAIELGRSRVSSAPKL